MTNHRRLTQLMHRAAQQAAPDNLDLWPAIRERLGPVPAANTRRVPGILTAASTVGVVIAGLLIFLLVRGIDDSTSGAVSHPPMMLTASLPAQDAPADKLCKDYPSFCVPFVGGVTPDDPLAAVETPANARAQHMPGGPAGVVRGAAPGGLLLLGNPAAPARFEVALDFECPHCATLYLGTLKSFIDGDVAEGNAVLQLRLAPTTGSAYASEAAQSALCAGEQGAFWEMTTRLLADRASDAPASDLITHIPAIAEGMGLDAVALDACVASERYVDLLDRNRQSLLADDGTAAVPTVWYVDRLSGEHLELADPSATTLARFVDAAEAQQGVNVLAAVDVTGTDFSDRGIYVDENSLGVTKPREYYHVKEANAPFYTGLAAADGWALLIAQGGQYVPTLTVAQLIASETTPVNASYRTFDGVLLFNWLNDTHLTDPNQPAQISYDVMVDDGQYSVPGDYTLTLRPLGDVIDLSAGARDITLDYDTPQVVRFQALQDQPLRLTVEVTSYTTPEQVMPGVLTTAPEIAILLPYGETLATFQPGRSDRLDVDFVPPSADESLLVFNLMPDTLSEAERRAIVLHVSVAPTAAAPADEVIIPNGRVAVSIPTSAFSLVGSSLQAGQPVDVIGTVPMIDGDSDFSAPLAIGPDMEPVRTVTQMLVDNALVVRISPFPTGDSGGDGQTGSFILTLAVSPEDAATLTWAIDAKIPLVITPAEE